MLSQTEIEHVLRSLGVQTIKNSGDQLICSCPFAPYFHKSGRDRNPSFSVALWGEHKWKCFGGSCGVYGTNLYWLIDRYEEVSGKDLSGLKEQVDKYERKIKDNEFRPRLFRDRKAYRWPPQNTFPEEKPPTFDFKDFARHYTLGNALPGYAIERRLTLETWKRWSIGFDGYRSRLFIPVFDHTDAMVGWSSRRILDEEQDKSPKYLHAKGFQKDRYFYGEHLIDTSSDVAFLSEGFFDVWAMNQAGLKNTLAFMGTGVGDEQLVKIVKWFKRVVIFPHNDKPDVKGNRAGEVIARKWIDALRRCSVVVYVVQVPDPYKDVGDLTPGQIKSILKGARKQ